jgi:oligoribonuclease NrnB/cAMP/cGMP phosphodiesterase (DHH superfamily)
MVVMGNNIQCFSHSDLDGVVSNLLFCKYYNLLGYSHSTERGSSGDDIDSKILEYINSKKYSEDDIIIITDVCMSYAVATILDNLPNKKIHLDHHETSLKNLCRKDPNKNDFDWSYIKEGDSATMMVYRYIDNVSKDNNDVNIVMRQYRPLVVVTDLWDTKPRDSEEFVRLRVNIEEILTLMNSLGFNDFKARFMINPSIELGEVEYTRVVAVNRVKMNVLRYTNVNIRPIRYRDKSCCYGVCFSNMYRSEIADYAFKNNSELMFMVIVDMNSGRLSFRRSNNNELDLTVIAKQFDSNGGGHPFACGAKFSIDNYKYILDKLFSGDFELERV